MTTTMPAADPHDPTQERLGKPLPDDTAERLLPLRAAGVQLSVGRYSYGSPKIHYAPNDQKAQLTIGGFCSIGPGCQIYIGVASRHYTDFITTFPLSMVFGIPSGGEASRASQGDLAVCIGSDVWIGVDVIIMAGIHIGHGAVIGARSVVTHDVPPYAVVGGTPSRVIKYRFQERTIRRLLALAWWDWPDSQIKDNLICFYTQDIEIALTRLEGVVRQVRKDGDTPGG